MRMFKRRNADDVDGTATTTDDRRAYRTDDGQQTYVEDGRSSPTRDDRVYPASRDATTADDYTPDDGRRWHHGPTRAIVTLLAAGIAGLLAWLTTNIGHGTNGGYWAVYGILAGAGLVMALSQVIGGWTKRGRPTFSPSVFLLAFVPTLIAAGWILVFHQPHTGLFRGHVMNWSGDIGIRGLVNDMGGNLLSMLAFGIGLVFGFCFDTTGARRPLPPARQPVRQPTVADTDADQPIARERETVRS